MSVRKYLNRNKIGGLILIIVIIIAFGFGGFGGGFLSNNQNNIVKIDENNITTQDFINFINESGISEKVIQNRINDNIIEELLSSLVSKTLLELEIKDFNIKLSENSLSKKIKLNKNFLNDDGKFERIKYEKFLLENNTSAPRFEKRLKDRELQKKLFDFIGAGTVSPQFFVKKLFENENKKLKIDYINLEPFYEKKDQIDNQEITTFIGENLDQLKIEYIDFRYSVINPENIIGINEFNQEFFDKIDEIENDILNGESFSKITKKFDLPSIETKNYRFSKESKDIEKKIYELRNNKMDIFENNENFIFYKIENLIEKEPDISDTKTKEEILKLIIEKKKFEYNTNLLDQISKKKFSEDDFLKFGEDKIQNLTLNSIADNKKFEINSVKILYTMPINTFTLVNDEKGKIYLVKIKKYIDVKLNENSDNYKSYIDKENSKTKNTILESYDILLNDKYKVKVNEVAINNVKNLFQ